VNYIASKCSAGWQEHGEAEGVVQCGDTYPKKQKNEKKCWKWGFHLEKLLIFRLSRFDLY
jgi:hypothetical protein